MATHRRGSSRICSTRTKSATHDGRQRCARCWRRSGSSRQRPTRTRRNRVTRACSTDGISRAGAIVRRPRLTGRTPGSGRRRTRTRPPGRSSIRRVSFDGMTASPDGRFAAIGGRLVVNDVPGRPQDPATLDGARVSAGLHPEAGVPGDAERRQRRLPSRAATAGPRLRPGRPVQEPHALPSAGLERADRHRPRRHGAGHLQRRSARDRDAGARDRADRCRGRPRADGIPPDSDNEPRPVGSRVQLLDLHIAGTLRPTEVGPYTAE